MKYELGDKVKIKAHWRKVDYSKQLEDKGIESLENYLASDDMAGDFVRLLKHEKVGIDEDGFIVGTRQIKTEYDLMDDSDLATHSYDVNIRQVDSKHETVYLVATRMNCLRRVSFKDIKYIYEENSNE